MRASDPTDHIEGILEGAVLGSLHASFLPVRRIRDCAISQQAWRTAEPRQASAVYYASLRSEALDGLCQPGGDRLDVARMRWDCDGEEVHE